MPITLLNHSALALFAHRRAFPLLPAALASASFGFVLVRDRVHKHATKYTLMYMHLLEMRPKMMYLWY